MGYAFHHVIVGVLARLDPRGAVTKSFVHAGSEEVPRLDDVTVRGDVPTFFRCGHGLPSVGLRSRTVGNDCAVWEK